MSSNEADDLGRRPRNLVRLHPRLLQGLKRWGLPPDRGMFAVLDKVRFIIDDKIHTYM